MLTQRTDLDDLREFTSRVLLAAVWFHVLVALIIALMRSADWQMPTLFSAAMAILATASWFSSGSNPSTRLIFAVALMADVSLFTYELNGHPWQADMHMYFFSALACLVAYCDYRPILFAAIAVSMHHLVLNFLLPAAIYPGGTDIGRAFFHAGVLFMEAAVLSWLSVKLSQVLARAEQKTAEARAASEAERQANKDRADSEIKAKQDRELIRRELADGFEQKVFRIVGSVAESAQEMQNLSLSMSNDNADTVRQVAAAAMASTGAATNVETIASSTTNLSSSITKISQQVSRSAELATKAAQEARSTNDVVGGLADGTHKIGEVLTLIQSIASQTNLLALNATIEAARAGEHGRGFSVVAGEVKALANQTAKATDEISTQIQRIQEATGQAVNAIHGIGGTIREIDAISRDIAAAVDRQEAATLEIGENLQQASNGAEDTSRNIQSVASASERTSYSASQIKSAAHNLTSQADRLKLEVGEFLGSLRAA
jgi:methyl-accepting chemotaxis protein